VDPAGQGAVHESSVACGGAPTTHRAATRRRCALWGRLREPILPNSGTKIMHAFGEGREMATRGIGARVREALARTTGRAGRRGGASAPAAASPKKTPTATAPVTKASPKKASGPATADVKKS